MKTEKELQQVEEKLRKLIMDTDCDKYRLIPYIARWAGELKYKEETKDLLDSERINRALEDVLTGQVTVEEIAKLPPLSARKRLNLIETTVKPKSILDTPFKSQPDEDADRGVTAGDQPEAEKTAKKTRKKK
jgi:DNA-directed RNA polymerase subunit K/omega